MGPIWHACITIAPPSGSTHKNRKSSLMERTILYKPVLIVGCRIIILKVGCRISKFWMKADKRIMSCGGARKHNLANRFTKEAISISGTCLSKTKK